MLPSGLNRFSVNRFKTAEKNDVNRFLVLRIMSPWPVFGFLCCL